MYAIPLIAVMLLGLLILGGLAVVAILAVMALRRKRPGVAAAMVLVPVGLLLGLVVLVGFSAMPVRHVLSPSQSDLDYDSPESSTAVLRVPTPPHVPYVSTTSHVGYSGFVWGRVIMLVALAAVVLFVLRHLLGARDPDDRRGGWGKAFVLLLAVFIGVRLWSANVADQQQSARQEVARAKSELENAARQIEQAAAAGNSSMQELWDQVNKPRIQLDAEDTAASVESSRDGPTVKIEAKAQNGKGAKATARAKPAVKADKSAIAAPAVAPAEAAAPAPIASEADKQAVVAEETDRGRGRPNSPTAEHGEKPSEPSHDAPRPAWVDQPPKRVGTVWREVVISGDYATPEECYREADQQMMGATYNHLAQITGMPENLRRTWDDSRVWHLNQLGIGVDYIRRQIVPEDGEYFETVERSVGPMKKLYTLLEFTPSVDRDLRQRWENYAREERMQVVGILSSLALCVVGLVYGLLKIDTWTKGYYTKRLFLGVPAAIIGFVALVALLNSL